jgi:hypothetical protein
MEASIEPYGEKKEDVAATAVAIASGLAPPPLSPKPPTIHSPNTQHGAPVEERENDVVMYNPEDDCSISIRRSSIAPSNRLSRLEHQSSHFSRSPRFPLGSRLVNQSVISHSMFSPPTSPRYGGTTAANTNDPHSAVIPTIVCSEIETNQAVDSPRMDTNNHSHHSHPPSPTMFITTPHADSPRLSTSSSAGNTSTTLASAKGLGITDSKSSPIASPPPAITATSAPLSDSQSPKKRLQPHSPSQRHPPGSLSPDMAKGTTVPSSPPYQYHHNHQQQQAPHSPSQQQHGGGNTQSMMASVLSVRSSVVVPYDNTTSDEKVHDDDETKHMDNEELNAEEEQDQDAELRGKFIAFKKRSWLNPFYLAILSSGAMGIAIVFMIIYDITLLGMGNNVFE